MLKKVLGFLFTSFKKNPISSNTLKYDMEEFEIMNSNQTEVIQEEVKTEEKKKRGRKKKSENIE
jgi:hypothetical protein